MNRCCPPPPPPPPLLPAQIDREAARKRPGVTVSSTLLFSSPGLQDQFHAWMAEIPAVRWNPLLVLGLGLMIPFWLLLSRDECGWIHVLAFGPGMLLTGARVAAEAGGWSKQAQSLCSLLSIAYLKIMINALMAAKDTCCISIGPDGTSLAAAVAYAAMGIIFDIAIAPCTVQHAPVLCWILGVGWCTQAYVQYLHQNGGLTSDESDPYLLRLLAIVFSSVYTSLVVCCARVYLAKDLMIGFLRSLPHGD